MRAQQQPALELALSLEVFPAVIKQLVAFPPSEGTRMNNIKQISISLILQNHTHFFHRILTNLSPQLINMIILGLAGENYEGLFEKSCRREILYMLKMLSNNADPLALKLLHILDPDYREEFAEIRE